MKARIKEVSMRPIDFAVIGGSGFYSLPGLTQIEERVIKTPFGLPSAPLCIGELNGQRVVFLARHGIGHTLSPSELNYLANFYALKSLGVKTLISVTAVGSLRQELRPRDLVIPDQFFDNTFKREKSFFRDGIVAHVSLAEPCCPPSSRLAHDLAQTMKLPVHLGGTYFNMEGPQFSSKAESAAYRQLGFSIIGMTQAPEAKLARECEFCFIPLAFVTDYDCWHEETAAVTVEMVIANLNHNVENAQNLVSRLIDALGKQTQPACHCHSGLANAIITRKDKIPRRTLERLQPIISKYVNKKELS